MRERVATLLVACAHTLLVVLTTVGFFVFEPLVRVVAPGSGQGTALDIVYSVLHSLVCLVPVGLVVQSRAKDGLTRGIRQATTVACALALLVQALRLACLTYVAMSAAVAVGTWLATLVALAVDVLLLVALLMLTITARLDTISGAQRRARRVLVLCVAHFGASAAAFFIIAALDVTNVYLTYAGGLSVLHALLLFVGGAVFPAYYVHLRSSVDGQLSLAECVACCVYLAPWVALDASLIAVAQTLVDGPLPWQLYFGFIMPAIDMALCVALAAAIVHVRFTLRSFNPHAVPLVPGSAAWHNDL